jgi:acyl-CoA synthetase (AMP-forming)/AMP-acid ligase II
MGEAGLALVVPAGGAPPGGFEAELEGWLRERLANYKVPAGVRLIDSLPVNAGGKVLKRELRRRYSDAE